jgi:DNA sulfur modification protein DndE
VKQGWLVNLKVGHYGTDYMARAWLAAFGIPANAPKDAVYPIGLTDADGDALDASKHNYVIHFASKDDLPPVNGFWSLTMYDKEYFFVENPLNRYTLSERNELKTNADGSIDLYFGPSGSAPEGLEANWIETLSGKGFYPFFRFYSPTVPLFDGTWTMPDIEFLK